MVRQATMPWSRPPELLCHAKTCERKIRSRSARAEAMSFDGLRHGCLSRAAKQSSTSGKSAVSGTVRSFSRAFSLIARSLSIASSASRPRSSPRRTSANAVGGIVSRSMVQRTQSPARSTRLVSFQMNSAIKNCYALSAVMGRTYTPSSGRR